MVETVTTWIHQNLHISPVLQAKLFGTFFFVVILLVLRWTLVAIVHCRTQNTAVIYRWRKLAEYVALGLGVIVISLIWLTDAQSLVTYFALLSAALAIALQDPITNFVGWFLIVWRRPFSVGDRIEIGTRAGDVIDIRYFQFTLMEIRNWVDADQSTGRVLHIPNKKVFNEAVANYSKGFAYIWHEIPVEVTFESDWRKAKKILVEIGERHAAHLSEDAQKRVREATKHYMIHYANLTPTVYTRVDPSGVLLTLRYLSDPRKRRISEQAIWEEILDAFAFESEVEFAYPTQRIYYHPQEGRPSLRPDILTESGLHPLRNEED